MPRTDEDARGYPHIGALRTTMPQDPLSNTAQQQQQQQQQHGGSSSSSSSQGFTHYPAIPTFSEAPSAPPLPADGVMGPAGGPGARTMAGAPPPQQQQQPAGGAGVALIAPPKIEPQPWVKDLWRTLAATTTGVLRFDLTRPTFPRPEEYDPGNILVKRGYQRRRGRPRKQQPPPADYPPYYGGPYGLHDPYGYNHHANAAAAAAAAAEDGGARRGQQPLFTGARLKLMRCLQVNSDSSKKPLLDLGLGAGLDVNAQRLHFIARLKLGGLFTVRLLPQPSVKLGGTWRVPSTGVAVRLRYECPLGNLGHPWQPPARLMLRLDNDVGTGVHLSPGGLEFDERRLALGKNTEVRMGAMLQFPRSLPLEADDTDAFKLKVHRLSLKSLW